MENFAAFLGYAQALPRMTYLTVVLVSQFFCLFYMFTTTSSFHSLIAAFYFLSLPMDICGFFLNLIRVITETFLLQFGSLIYWEMQEK